MDEAKKSEVFATGATRVPVKEAFHLICPELERRVSLICAEGLENYRDKEFPEVEVTTAIRGMPLYNLIKHAQRHWNFYRAGRKDEDHLAKMAWAIQQIMHQENKECQHYEIFIKG